jgi:hypothetical protein
VPWGGAAGVTGGWDAIVVCIAGGATGAPAAVRANDEEVPAHDAVADIAASSRYAPAPVWGKRQGRGGDRVSWVSDRARYVGDRLGRVVVSNERPWEWKVAVTGECCGV